MADGTKPIAIGDLWLGIYLRPLHPEFFNIRARRIFTRPDYEAEFWLVDPGHVFMILVGRDCITEILAPQGMELPKRGLLKRWQLRREHEEELRLRGRFVYQMSFQVEQMPMAEYLQLEAELRASSLEHGVFRGFAGRATAGESSSTMRWQPGEAPFAYALPESRSDAFLLQTFHGFPAEHTILKVQTVVDVSSA